MGTRGRKRKYNVGDLLTNNVLFVKELDSIYNDKNRTYQRQGVFQDKFGNYFVARLNNIVDGHYALACRSNIVEKRGAEFMRVDWDK